MILLMNELDEMITAEDWIQYKNYDIIKWSKY